MILLRVTICAFLLLCCRQQIMSQDNNDAERYGSVEDASELMPGEDPDEKIRKNFFLRAEISKTDCYVGEPLMAVFKAYSRLDANSQVVKRPSLSGFSVIEMVDAYNNQPDVEKYKGEYYYVHLIRKVQLFPLQAGDFIIEPAEVESVIQLRNADERSNRLRMRGIFRRGRRDPSLQRQMVFRTPEVAIHVNALPEEKQPDDFDGAVGNFRVALQMDDTAAVQHESSKIRLRITGTGNFPLITDPQVKWPEGLRVSPPAVNEDVNRYQFPLFGEKIFEYSVDNSETGTFTIPAVSFTYFDPTSGSYTTVQSKPLIYTVKAADSSKKSLPIITDNAPGGVPMHYYYFGIVVAVIIGVIVYMAVKKKRTSP